MGNKNSSSGIKIVGVNISLGAILLMLFAVWVSQFEANGERTASSPPQQNASTTGAILEVTATDFQIGPEQDYLYLQVFPDRRAEAQTLNRKTMFDKAVVADVKTTLRQDEFAEIQNLIEAPEILKLDALYRQRIADVLDVFTSWKVKIRHTEHVQELVVIAFAPEQAKLMHRPYLKPLLKLGCTIEKFRSETVGEKVHLDDECKKAIWMSHSAPKAKS
jgi:hypothetical protein